MTEPDADGVRHSVRVAGGSGTTGPATETRRLPCPRPMPDGHFGRVADDERTWTILWTRRIKSILFRVAFFFSDHRWIVLSVILGSVGRRDLGRFAFGITSPSRENLSCSPPRARTWTPATKLTSRRGRRPVSPTSRRPTKRANSTSATPPGLHCPTLTHNGDLQRGVTATLPPPAVRGPAGTRRVRHPVPTAPIIRDRLL